MSNQPARPLLQRRNDIQGLRVISALLVFSFHVFFSGVSGGVDVFFVVSGYFMAANAAKRGEIAVPPSLLSFYREFLLRVAPQAILALLGILLLLFFLTSPMVWATNLRDIGASAIYLENFRLISRGQDYLARSESLTLVQHFWAVSLIGQSYFAWPLILRLNKLVAVNTRQDPRKLLTPFVAALSFASFCWCLYFTDSSPSSAYFDFFSRFWEFGCGALLGSHAIGRTDTPLADLWSWLGVALIASCGFVVGSTLAFPGYASAWPVMGALLFIRYGRADNRHNASRYLSRPWLARLGSVSFGVYLWHWPLYVVYTNSTNNAGAVPLLPGLGLLALSITCAFVSKQTIDWCFSSRRVSSSTTLVPLGFLSLLLLISSSSEFARREVNENGSNWDASNLHMTGFILPGPFSVRDDNASVYKSGCHQNGTSDELKTCSFGRPDAKKKIVLVGGSHSTHWLPALVLHAEKEGWQIISMTKSGCLFADPADQAAALGTIHASCRTWNQAAMRTILAIKPDLVVTLATRYSDGASGRTEYVPDGYVSYFRQLAASAIPTLALRDNPWMHKDVPVCVYSPVVSDKNICGAARPHVLNDEAFAKEIKAIPAGVHVADLSAQFCDSTHCWAMKDNVVIYRDSNHMTASYAERISPALRDAVNQAWTSKSH